MTLARIAFAATWFVLGMVAGASVLAVIGSLFYAEMRRQNETQDVTTEADQSDRAARFVSTDEMLFEIPQLAKPMQGGFKAGGLRVHRRYPRQPEIKS